MKAQKTYLKGKSIFVVSLLVIGVTFLTVYLTGLQAHRSLTINLYVSLTIIASSLFIFMVYGLYKGVGLIDDFPKFMKFKKGDYIDPGEISTETANLDIDVGDGIGALVLSILLWIAVTILFVFLLILLEAILWFSFFIILGMLYWLFFRALKFVFSKSSDTKGKIRVSVLYSISYTTLYIGWIFGIVYITQLIK
ncbi:hypothetical protein [Aquimarina sp. 2201CG5-10]|uniref:hypothetical protein n=1 Tax=Aquimarina callyspongiae TaxID=3098150 RepID=UPI002AB3AE21|nr:hypothetical protein [Aquimarina sp. 2201CG5-10]MDY8137435.1 hypothetical protein [Aquimarina sp. 2201CG5-10]